MKIFQITRRRVLVCVCLMVIGMCGVAAHQYHLSKGIEERLSKLRRMGEPITRREYFENFGPTDLGSTSLWERTLRELNLEVDRVYRTDDAEKLPYFFPNDIDLSNWSEREAAKAFMERCEPIWRNLVAASKLPAVGSEDSRLIDLCMLKAHLAADLGDSETIASAVRILLARGDAVRNSGGSNVGPSLMDFRACELINAYIGVVPADSLAEFREHLAAIDYQSVLKRDLYFRRIEAIQLFQNGSNALTFLDMSNQWADEDDKVSLADKAIWYATRNQDFAHYLDAMEDYVVAASDHFPQATNEAKKAHGRWFPNAPLLSRTLLRTGPRMSFGWTCRDVARQRMMMAIISAELFRRATGDLPTSLADLRLEDPIDPYTGKPIRFVRTEDDITLYCVGPNRRDENGQYGHYIELIDGWKLRAYADDFAIRFGEGR